MRRLILPSGRSRSARQKDLGAFEPAELWSDRTAWPVAERTAYDELAELACMSALAMWLTRWQPLAIHGAMLAGAKPAAVALALGGSVDEVYRVWREWALRQRDFIIGGKPGITAGAYQAVAQRFAVLQDLQISGSISGSATCSR